MTNHETGASPQQKNLNQNLMALRAIEPNSKRNYIRTTLVLLQSTQKCPLNSCIWIGVTTINTNSRRAPVLFPAERSGSHLFLSRRRWRRTLLRSSKHPNQDHNWQESPTHHSPLVLVVLFGRRVMRGNSYIISVDNEPELWLWWWSFSTTVFYPPSSTSYYSSDLITIHK